MSPPHEEDYWPGQEPVRDSTGRSGYLPEAWGVGDVTELEESGSWERSLGEGDVPRP